MLCALIRLDNIKVVVQNFFIDFSTFKILYYTNLASNVFIDKMLQQGSYFLCRVLFIRL